ncbi:unnamed protein product [Phytophthora fragariaefolia]|uniref:Unnamed protein product n=1 Tax=Phytophthora fragariaefolia TaxID=1490495 RepID=A0A9W6YDY1_9STRA|nr:unnamed protein product [Phytophthora fragariaefolia]
MKIFVVATISLAAFFVSEAEASKKYVKLLPNGGNVPNVPAIGHTDGTGDDEATNAFGDAFAAADYAWTKDLCEADSDGDGQTNGQELGDPCCVWAVGGTPQWTSGVSNPGDAASTSDSSLWANACGASTSTSEAPTETTSESPAASSTASESTEDDDAGTGADSHDVADADADADVDADADADVDADDAAYADADAEASASSSTNSTTSSYTTTAAEKCASDLASTRALRVNN